jgi:hypothetical protein
VEIRRDAAWHAGVTPFVTDAEATGASGGAMTLWTREQLHAETDRRYLLRHPDGPPVTDPDDAAHDPCEIVWLEIRDEVLSCWTDDVFRNFFPTAGPLDASDSVLIEYWNDIKDQISGRPGRWSWESVPE